MLIARKRVNKSLRGIRKLYQRHAREELSPSRFISMARAELNALYFQHTRELVQATADRVMDELRSLQTQFGLDLDCHWSINQVARGYRGIRASIYVRNKTYTYSPGSVQIFIGPFDEWNKIAVHTIEEREAETRPSFYTKRKRNSWQDVQDFNVPELLQRIKEDVERPEPEYDDEDDIPF